MIGLHTDNSPFKQPENTYRFALNTIMELEDGNRQSLSSEPGNVLCFSLPTNYKILSHIQISDNKIILFSTNGTNSEIGQVENCIYTTIVNSGCLGFSNGIKATHFTKNGCEDVIYFVDEINPDRYFNVSKPELFYTDAYQTYLNAGGSPSSYLLEKWNCNLFNLNPLISPLNVSDFKVYDTGGNLELGAYHFAFKYKGTSNFTNIFGPIYITDSDNLLAIDGGFNKSNSSEFIGGVSPTNKSIELSLTNLDTNFDTLEIYVIEYTTGDGITPQAFKIIDLNYTNSSLTYTYTGRFSDNIKIDIADITVQNPIYNKSKDILVVEDSLLRANVSEIEIDYYELQEVANNIRITFGYDTTDINSSYKLPEEIYNVKTFMRDEVYSFGIQFVYETGQVSSVLHIPGRKIDKSSSGVTLSTVDPNTHNRAPVSSASVINGWDSSIYANTGFYGNDVIPFGNNVPRWKVYNTAIDYGAGLGEMGYYECDTLYPDIRNCDGVPIYPHTVISPGVYQMDKIRHCRMPDETLLPLYNGNLITHIFPLFNNIILPTNKGIVGYKIVVAKRTDEHKTVLDKGVAERTIHGKGYISTWLDKDDTIEALRIQSNTYNLEYGAFDPIGFQRAGRSALGLNLTSITENRDVVHSIITPEIQFEKISLPADFIKIESRYTGAIKLYDEKLLRENAWDLMSDERWWTSSVNLNNRAAIPANGLTNRIINGDPIELQFGQYIEANGEKYKSYNQQYNVMYNVELPHSSFNGNIKDATDVYTTFGVSDAVTTSYFYVSLKRNLPNAYSNLFSIGYERLHDNVQTGTACDGRGTGDVFISKLHLRKTCSISDRTFDVRNMLITNKNILQTAISYLPVVNLFRASQQIERTVITHIEFFTESIINCNFRNEGFDLGRDHKDKNAANDVDENAVNMNVYYPKSFSSELKKYLLFPINFITWLSYNKDFSSLKSFETFRSFNPNYDYCSECVNEYPTRIIYSEPDFNESQSDVFRTVLANNYVDLPSNTGGINNIVYFRKNLLILTDSNIWRIQVNHQRIESSAENLYIGTGDFLSLKPEKLIENSTGYGGNKEKFNIITTEFGIFYTSNIRVFRFYDSLEPISERGMSAFFKNNLDYHVPQNDLEYPNEFVGMLTYYDPQFERILFTKRDYRLVGTGTNYLDLTNYARESFTISYDIKNQSWASFHSYIPRYAFNDVNTFFTTPNGNSFYKHLKTNHLKYYNKYQPHMIEIIAQDVNSFNLNSVFWSGRFYIYDNIQKWKLMPLTFNKCWVYNDDQVLKVDLNVKTNPYQNITWNNLEKVVYLADNTWRFSQIRDLSNGTYPLLIEDKNDSQIKGIYYLNDYEGFVDKVVNSNAINLNKSQYEQSDMRSNYHAIRLIFDNTDANLVQDFKLTLDLINSKKLYSYR